MLAAIVNGGIPAVDVVLSWQLPVIFWPRAGGSEGGTEAGFEGGREVLTPPPHPHSRTTAESSHEVLDKCFMEPSPSCILGVLWPMGGSSVPRFP